MARQPRHTLAARILARLDALAACTSVPGQTTRPFLTPAHGAAAGMILAWLREAGVTASLEATGTVAGLLDGSVKSAKTLLIGAPIDTSRDAGCFDGCLGLVLTIEVLAELRRLGQQMPFAVAIAGYGNDAAMRFATVTPGQIAGTADVVDGAALAAVDADGVSLRAALTAFGCDVSKLAGGARQAKDLLGYIEIQADQTGCLEMDDVPLGVVTTLHGISRYTIDVGGKVPGGAAQQPTARRDALAAAAEMILAVERIAKASPALTATVCQVGVRPGLPDGVPEDVSLMLDIRCAIDRSRRRGSLDIDRELRAIARRRQVGIRIEEHLNLPSLACDPRFIAGFNAAAEASGNLVTGLPGSLRHDRLPVAGLCPVGMLLIRTRASGGRRADAFVAAEDIEVAARHLMQVFRTIAPNGRNLT